MPILQGSDVLAVLLTGFGTSLIFQPQFAAAAAIEKNQHQQCWLFAHCKVSSMTIAEARRMGMSAASIADISDGRSQGRPN